MGIFDGLKILEFGGGVATPLASRYFIEQGARVIRVESQKRPDFLRVLNLGPHNPLGLDGAPMFILLNPNKESVAVDMTKPEGAQLVKKLVGWADVMTENFSPGVMQKFGIDYASLEKDHPRLIMVSGCLFGQTGPQRMYPGFGGQSSAIAGFNHLTGWADREAVGPFGTISDSLSARYVGLVVAAALWERRRSGKGQYIDCSQIEACVYSLSEMMVRQSASGETIGRSGNHDEAACPHAIYPCRDDGFLAISCFSDDEWHKLRRQMGDPAWAKEARFATLGDRKQHESELDRKVAEWTATEVAAELMHKLQRAGVAAGVAEGYKELLEDPALVARGHYQTVRHPHLGDLRFEYSALKFSESPRHFDRPGPNLGQDTDRVLAEVLGLSDDEIARLHAAEVLR